MNTSELRLEMSTAASPLPVSPTRQLAAALLHVLGRDEPLPARWRADPFVLAVGTHRSILAGIPTFAELDRLAPPAYTTSFQTAVALLASEPLAAALAVRTVELAREAPLPAWPVIVRHGIGPRVSHADAGRWFG